jgi:PAS domain S-box-containing protein
LPPVHYKKMDHTFLDLIPEAVFVFDSASGTLLDVNPKVCEMFGCTYEELLHLDEAGLNSVLEPFTRSGLEKYTVQARTGKIQHIQWLAKDRCGNSFWAEAILRIAVIGGIEQILVTVRDISPARSNNDILLNFESRYRQLVEQIHAIIYIDAVDDTSTALYMSPQVEDLLGYSSQEWLEDSELWLKLLHPDDLERVRNEHILTNQTGVDFSQEYRLINRTGGVVWIHDEAVLERDEAGNPEAWHGIMYDVTTRHAAEEARREAEQRLHDVVEHSTNLFYIHTPEYLLTYVSSQSWEFFDCSPDDAMGKWTEFLTDNPLNTRGIELTQRAIDSGVRQPAYELELKGRKGRVIWVEVHETPIVRDGKTVSVVGSLTDITESKRDGEKIRLELDKLDSLRVIDTLIMVGLDLNLILKQVLEHTISHLKVDASGILLLSDDNQFLEYAAGHGFRTNEIERTRLSQGDGLAWRVVMGEQHIAIRDPHEEVPGMSFSGLMQREGFNAYVGTPLIVKKRVKGVLEVFHRTILQPDKEWLDYLDTLAGQAAIAIENARLFQDLQGSNQELTRAYEATIAGWSKALELRDKETKGHSERVSGLAVQLAHKMGFNEEELIHFRRGVLLHDIGKMAIPDSILFKPTHLDADEWVVMRQHPVYAWQLLKDIPYLQLSIDVPYCHHEKWDGSGYPCGLKGEEIPLTARIFAIVDVWDALTSDRPYRPAWPRDEVIRYLRNESDKHFDPQVVDKFLMMIG